MEDNFTRDTHGDVTVEIVEISRCTIKEAHEFKKILTKDISSGRKKIVVDLNKCEFMDSTFLSTLVSTLKALLKAEGNLKLCCINDDVMSLLELAGTNKVFEIYNKRSEAVNSYNETQLREGDN